jgi:hypothetical protein
MFFKHDNGSYKRVPIMQNSALPNGINGGMTIYYTQQDFNSNGNQKITAFPKVSRVIQYQHPMLIPPGLPHDSWQSHHKLARRCKETRWATLCLFDRQEHTFPRASRLSHQGMQRWHYDSESHPLPKGSDVLTNHP